MLKRILGLSAIAVSTALLHATSVQSQMCFVVWPNGQTQNLDALCLGQSVMPSDVGTSAVPTGLAFQELDVKGNLDNSGLGRIVGMVQNTSAAPVRVDFVEFQLSDRRRGVVLGSITTRMGVVLQPGQSAKINQSFDNDVIGLIPYGRVAVQVTDWL